MDDPAKLRMLPEFCRKLFEDRFKVERWATPDEGLLLYGLAQSHEVSTYLECGTANGFTALWAAAAGVKHLHTWDIVDRPKVWATYPQDWAEHGARIRCHVGRFEEGVGSVYAPAPRLFFIDGHHSRTAARRDWRAVKMLWEPGDVVVLHDANEAPVRSLCESLRTVHGYRGGIVRTARGMGVYFAK